MNKELFPGWTPLQVARHYRLPIDSYSGKGQTVGIISLGGPIDVDVLKDEFDSIGVPLPALHEKKVSAPPLDPKQDQLGSAEVQMDIQVIGSICPDAAITVYRGAADAAGFAAAVRQAVDDGQSVVSISWGSSESTLEEHAGMEAALKLAAHKGITVCASAGDWGASNLRGHPEAPAPAGDGRAHVEYPASSHYVLACGGTELVSRNERKHEVVWNNFARKSGATGGGVSDLFPLPEWQAECGISIPSVNDGRIGRIIPDVAGLAAGGDWMIFRDFRPEVTGGTSAVTPLWAAFLMLVNEAREGLGKPRLGYVNPRLYKLAARGGLFNNIVEGNNRRAEDQPGYDAAPGFNACAGWGSPLGDRLFTALLED